MSGRDSDAEALSGQDSFFNRYILSEGILFGFLYKYLAYRLLHKYGKKLKSGKTDSEG